MNNQTLINLLSEGYDGPYAIDSSIQSFFDYTVGKPIIDNSGDGLAKFIVYEAYDVAGHISNPIAKLEETIKALSIAEKQIQNTVDRLSKELDRYKELVSFQ